MKAPSTVEEVIGKRVRHRFDGRTGTVTHRTNPKGGAVTVKWDCPNELFSQAVEYLDLEYEDQQSTDA